MKRILLVFSFFISVLAGLSQPASLDATFNPADAGFGKGDGPNFMIKTIANLPSGKTLIAGAFDAYNGMPCGTLARLNADGTLDETFNAGGSGANGGVNTIALLADGKILIGGNFERYNGKPAGNIARLHPDGSLDESFNVGNIGSSGEIYAITIQTFSTETKILIGGAFGSYNGTIRNNIARLNEDGTIDNSFHYVNGANKWIYAITLFGEKILIGGEFTEYNGIVRNHYACLNPDGTHDASFRHFSGSNNLIRAITVQPTSQGEKILIGGDFTMIRGFTRWGIARLHEDGSFDLDFDINGSGTDNTVQTIAVQADGKILIGGDFVTYSNVGRSRLARLNNNGTLDGSFTVGVGSNGTINAIAAKTNSKILIGGNFYFYNGNISSYFTQINENGSQDFSFNPGSGADQYVGTSAFQNDKLLIGGWFTSYNNKIQKYIARVHTDGTLDETFNAGGIGANNEIRKILVLPGGKILITGWFTEYNGKPCGGIARLHADGSLDETFNVGGTGANDLIYDIAVQSNGKILIGGFFVTFNGVTRYHLARLHENGTIDTDFDPGMSVLGGSVLSIIPQGDKIIIAGTFTSYQNVPRNNIARINSDGSLDNTFNASGSGANRRIEKMIQQEDGKILIAGWFTTYNGVSRNYLARLLPDGTLDESFAVGSGLDNIVNSFAIQRDGKVLIGGNFTQYNGIPRINLARLQSNGALDETFDPQSGAKSEIYTLAIQEDGHIIIGGNFTSYDGTGRNRLARIKGDNHTITLQAPVSTQFCPGSQVTVAYTKTGFYRLANQFAVQLSDASGSFTNATVIGTANTREAGNITATIPVNIPPGSGYRIRILSSLPALVSASNAADLTIAATASITTQPLPQTLCAGSAASFSVAATGSGLTYQWQKDGAAIAGATAASYGIPSVAASNAGNYQVVVTGTCGTATSLSVSLTVNAMPAIPVISASGNTLSSSATSGNQWFLNSTPIPSATGNTHQVTTSGTYTVQVSQNGCTSTSAPYQFVATAISGPGLRNGEVSLYPNPVFNQLNLRNVGGRKLSIQLFDIHGKTVRQWYTAQTTAILDVTGLAGGVYQIMLTDAAKNTSISQTIIKR